MKRHVLLCLLLSVTSWSSRLVQAVYMNKKHEFDPKGEPCYICAAEWKLRNSNRRIVNDINEQNQLAEDEDKCEATIVREVENALKMMQPESWQNTAIDDFSLKRDTDKFLYGNQNLLSVEQFRKKLISLNSRWEKYWTQQDYNKWTALRQWLRLPALRRRLQVLAKDLKSERRSRRILRLIQRVQRAQKVWDAVQKKLRAVYAAFHLEGYIRLSLVLEYL